MLSHAARDSKDEFMTTSFAQPPRTMDWSLGNYAHTAAQLLPAARVVVDRAAPA
jgi:hypothetical protein